MRNFWIAQLAYNLCLLSFLAPLDAQNSNCGITLEVNSDTTICSYPSTFLAEAQLTGIYDFFEWSPSAFFCISGKSLK